MHQRELEIEFLRITVREHVVFIVPFTSFQVHAVNIAACLWFLGDFLPGQVIFDNIFEAELVNSDDVITRIVLLRSSQEGLWEEESRDPVDAWSAVAVPILKELNSFNQIVDPRCQWLHRKMSFSFNTCGRLTPCSWDRIGIYG